MISSSETPLLLPKASFTLSLLVTSPVRCNLPFSPVGAIILPLTTVDARLGSLLIGGLNFLISFLIKYSLLHPPQANCSGPAGGQVTLTLEQLSQLFKAAREGRLPLPVPENISGSRNGQQDGEGPVGGDQPLFPDNLSVSLSLTSAFAPFDGSPDTSFNVPLFEVPGVPGNMLLILTLFIAQFMVEQTGIRVPNHQTPVPRSERSAPKLSDIPEY